MARLDRQDRHRSLALARGPTGRTRIGTVSSDTASAFGFNSRTAVVAGTTDGCAAFLATGAAETGDGVTSLGTTLTIKLLSETPVFSPQFGIYSHRIGDRWLAGGASNTAAQYSFAISIEAVFRPLNLGSIRRIRPGSTTIRSFGGRAVSDQRSSPPPSFVPSPGRRCAISPGLLEGIASIEALGYRRLAEIGASPLQSLRTVGGGARNTRWTKIRQRMIAVPFKVATHEEAAAGSAMLAWRGIGVVVPA